MAHPSESPEGTVRHADRILYFTVSTTMQNRNYDSINQKYRNFLCEIDDKCHIVKVDRVPEYLELMVVQGKEVVEVPPSKG